MATEPDAKGSAPRPSPLSPAARRDPSAPPRPPAARPDQPAPLQPPAGLDTPWHLGDELEGLEAGVQHVDVYPQAPPRPRHRPEPVLPAPYRELPVPRSAAAVVSISLVAIAVLLQLASVLSSGAGEGDLSAEPSRAVVAPGGRIELAGDGAPSGAELVLEIRRRSGDWQTAAHWQRGRGRPVPRRGSSRERAGRGERAGARRRGRNLEPRCRDDPAAAAGLRGGHQSRRRPRRRDRGRGPPLPVGKCRPGPAARRHRLREPRERRVPARHAVPEAVQLPRHAGRAGRPSAPLRDGRPEPGQ